MPMEINTCIKWSMLELRGLLEDEDAHVHFQRSRRHLGLHPFQLNDLNSALQQILSSKVNFYDYDLQGLILAYKNPKLVSPLAGILHDSYFVHVDIEADFYIFRPEIGCTLKGITNKKAENHFGVLVHKAFNVSIPKPDECQEWVGDSVSIGQEVKFTVTHLDFKGRLPFIRGQLIPDITMQGQRLSEAINTEEDDVNAIISRSPDDVKTVSNVREKKRSKKSKFLEDSTDSESQMDGFNVERFSNGKHEIVDSEVSSYECIKRKKLDSSSEKEMGTDDKKTSRKKRVKDEPSGDESDLHVKKSSRKKRVKDEPSMVDTDVEVETVSRKKLVKDESSADEKDIYIKRTSRKKRVKDEPSMVDTDVEVETVSRKKLVKDESSADEKDVYIKRTSRKKRVKDEPSMVDTDVEVETVSRKKLVKDESSADEKDVYIKRTPRKKLVKDESSADEKDIEVKRASRKNLVKDESSRDECQYHNEETDNIVETKPEIVELIKREKSHKVKRKRAESESKINVFDNNQEQRDKNDKTDGQNENDDIVIYPVKRARKNRILDSDSDDVSEIENKPDITVKKEKKKKKKQKVKEEEEEIEEIVSGPSCDNVFDFIKPDLDAFVTTSAKCKRKSRIKSDEEIIDESTESSSANLVEAKNEDENEFFRDIRVKAEPDPSDCEDTVSSKKDKKRTKKHSTKNGIKEDKDVKTFGEAQDDILFRDVEIKAEPDISDIEDTIPRKKKSKRRTLEGNVLTSVKIKVEPDASDVEDVATIFDTSFKTEPHESTN